MTELVLALDVLTDWQLRALAHVAEIGVAQYAAADPGIGMLFASIQRAAKDELEDRKAGRPSISASLDIMDRDAADPTDASRILPAVADALEAVAWFAPVDLFGTFQALAISARDAVRPPPPTH